MLLSCMILFISTSCSSSNDDTPSKPTITLTEVGVNNSKAVAPGDDLHLNAEITADGLIALISINIIEDNGTFAVDETFSTGSYVGVRNTTFHEHIDIPAEAPEGNYKLNFTVTDQKGQTTIVQSDLTVDADAAGSDHDE